MLRLTPRSLALRTTLTRNNLMSKFVSNNKPSQNMKELNKNFTHGDLYGVPRLDVETMSTQTHDYWKAVICSFVAAFLVWDVLRDYEAHAVCYNNPLNQKFHIYQPDRHLLGETEGAMDQAGSDQAAVLNGGMMFYGGRVSVGWEKRNNMAIFGR